MNDQAQAHALSIVVGAIAGGLLGFLVTGVVGTGLVLWAFWNAWRQK